MEYDPIAINEVLAYSFSSPSQVNRFYIELVNTLTSPELGTPTTPGLGVTPNTGSNNASVLDLAGFQSTGAATPWAGGCWDLVFTADNPLSRPDPITGQLQQGGTYYGLIPLVSAAFGLSSDPLIYPLPQSPPYVAAPVPTLANLFIGTFSNPTTPPWTYNPLAPNYFLTIGNPPAAGAETAPYTPTYTLQTAYDPFNSGGPGSAIPAGVLPNNATGQPVIAYPGQVPAPTAGSGTGSLYWVCLRRPANPFAPVSTTNPMIVVDAMRFPYIEGNVTPGTAGSSPKQASYFFSYQRLQPYRGGHAVPLPNLTSAIDPRYGYSEQIAVPVTLSGDQGEYSGKAITTPGGSIYHTLGLPNDNTVYTAVTPMQFYEPWDYFPFNDRDFTSVAELLMVPGCPPGLFTKQFAEFAASSDQPDHLLRQGQAAGQPDALGPAGRRVGRLHSVQRIGGGRAHAAVCPAHVPLSGGQVLLHRRIAHHRHARQAGLRRPPPATAGSRCSSSSRCPAR